MDTSFLSPGPITWAQLIVLALFLFSVGKGVDWDVGKLRTDTKEAVSPLTIDMAAAKIEIRSLEEKLNAFKIEVARTYVTDDFITRLERRNADMVVAVRDEMKETREAMLKAFMRRLTDSRVTSFITPFRALRLWPERPKLLFEIFI